MLKQEAIKAVKSCRGGRIKMAWGGELCFHAGIWDCCFVSLACESLGQFIPVALNSERASHACAQVCAGDAGGHVCGTVHVWGYR